MYYQMTVQVMRVNENGWHYSSGLPTFFLRDDMQGIISPEHACSVARHIVASCLPMDGGKIDDSTLEAVDITASGDDGSYATINLKPEMLSVAFGDRP